jgi:hypothetical protein
MRTMLKRKVKERKQRQKSMPTFRVARYFLVQHTKTGKIYTKMQYINYTEWPQIYPMATKYTEWPQNIPNGHKIYVMATKYVYVMATKYVYVMATKYVYVMATKYTKWP